MADGRDKPGSMKMCKLDVSAATHKLLYVFQKYMCLFSAKHIYNLPLFDDTHVYSR